jgi:hypothetical protein
VGRSGDEGLPLLLALAAGAFAAEWLIPLGVVPTAVERLVRGPAEHGSQPRWPGGRRCVALTMTR